MLGELQKKKFRHMFNVYDVDGNGVITWDDFILYVENLAAIYDWTEESPEYKGFRELEMQEWEEMCKGADKNQDEQISLDEYLHYTEDRVSRVGAHDREAELWFQTLDQDGNGQVTVEEYKIVLKAYGLVGVDAEKYFRMFDANGDGHLSKKEVRDLNRQFWKSNELDDPGNFILGPF